MEGIIKEVMDRKRTFHSLGETPNGEAFFSVSGKLGNGLVVRVWKTATLQEKATGGRIYRILTFSPEQDIIL